MIFRDESRSLIHRTDGRVYVRRIVGEALNVNCVQSTVKHRGARIMVWGCISRKGMEILDGNGYINILENAPIPTRDMLLSHESGYSRRKMQPATYPGNPGPCWLNSGLTRRMSL